MTTPSPRGSFPTWLVVAITSMVAVVWFASSLARFANPERYPIPAEVHYLMGLVITMVGGGTYALTRRKADDPPPPPTEVRDAVE